MTWLKKSLLISLSLLFFANAQAFVTAVPHYQQAQKEIAGIKLPSNFTLFNKIGTPPPTTLQYLTLIVPDGKALALTPSDKPSEAEATAYKLAATKELVLVWLGTDQNKKPLGFAVYSSNKEGAPANLFDTNGVLLKDSQGNVLETVYLLRQTATLIRASQDQHFKPVFLLGGEKGLLSDEMNWLVVNGKLKPTPITLSGQTYVEIQ